MLRKLIVCVLVLGCSVPTSGCLVVAAGVVVAAKKKHDRDKACEGRNAGQGDRAKAPAKDCDKRKSGG